MIEIVASITNWIGYFEMWFLAENEKTLRRTYAGLYLDFGPVG